MHTQQLIVDLAVWWRAVVFMLVGHVAGLVRVAQAPLARSYSGASRLGCDAVLWAGVQGLPTESDELAQEDVQASSADIFAAWSMRRHVKFCAQDQGAADAYLTRLLKPRASVEVEVINPDSGERLSVACASEVLGEGIQSWDRDGGAGDTCVNAAVWHEFWAARRAAQAETVGETADPLAPEEVMAELPTVNERGQTMRLPRAALEARIPPRGDAHVGDVLLGDLSRRGPRPFV